MIFFFFFRKFDHSQNDCFVLFLLTHGDNTGFHTRDKIFAYEKLFKYFASDSCPSLTGKPKLFFLQCCRGAKLDRGGLVPDDVTTKSPTVCLPITADLFMFFATFHDYFAWRNPNSGSWFVQELVKIFLKFGYEHDLLTLATLTCKQVAEQKCSNVPTDPLIDKKKQMPTFVSTLTKRLIFTIKS